MFENCIYDSTGAVLCSYRGYPFQCSEVETPDEWNQMQILLETGELEIAPYVAPDPPTPDAVKAFNAASARVKRDALLDQSDWLANRHRDQCDSGIETTLTSEQYVDLLAYRQALRDISSQEAWPSAIEWPRAPDVVAES